MDKRDYEHDNPTTFVRVWVSYCLVCGNFIYKEIQKRHKDWSVKRFIIAGLIFEHFQCSIRTRF